MKKTILIVITMLVFLSGLLTSEEILLKIPVRVFNSGINVEGLTVQDFNLDINGVKRNIEKLIPVTRELGVSDFSRTFILNFSLTEYGENISKGISYFADNILSKKDSIILWTPIKVYRINSNRRRQKILSDIEGLVKKDSITYKNFRNSAKDKLTDILNKLLGSSPNNKDSNSTSSSIIFFLNNYSREWSDFKKKYLIPDVGKYYGLISMLTYKYPGDKYFINFQQREIIPSQKKYIQAKMLISTFLSTVAGTEASNTSASISNAIQILDRNMLVTDNFDPEILYAPFFEANISYNVIFFNSFRQSGENADGLSPDYEGILRYMSKATGGVSVNTNDLESGLQKIRKKRDSYYNLVFKFNGKSEEKKIEIKIPDKKYTISHFKKFHKEEIENLLKLSKEEKINITDFSIDGHKVSFNIKGFKMEGKKEKIGIVKIKVELFDKNKNSVFSKENTLRAQNKSMKISFKFDSGKKGFFKFVITADDLKATRNSVFEKYIELK